MRAERLIKIGFCSNLHDGSFQRSHHDRSRRGWRDIGGRRGRLFHRWRNIHRARVPVFDIGRASAERHCEGATKEGPEKAF